MFVLQVIAQQMPVYVLEIVTPVLVLVPHIAVQQVMLFAQIQLLHVPVQVVEPSLIVAPVLMIHMVYADIQHVVATLAVKHMIMVLPAPPVTLVAAALVLRM